MTSGLATRSCKHSHISSVQVTIESCVHDKTRQMPRVRQTTCHRPVHNRLTKWVRPPFPSSPCGHTAGPGKSEAKSDARTAACSTQQKAGAPAQLCHSCAHQTCADPPRAHRQHKHKQYQEYRH